MASFLGKKLDKEVIILLMKRFPHDHNENTTSPQYSNARNPNLS